jgi:hypothetical protein
VCLLQPIIRRLWGGLWYASFFEIISLLALIGINAEMSGAGGRSAVFLPYGVGMD